MPFMSGRAIKTESPFNPPASFPDPATCRVKLAGFGGYMDCLNKWAGAVRSACHSGRPFVPAPLNREILAQSEMQAASDVKLGPQK